MKPKGCVKSTQSSETTSKLRWKGSGREEKKGERERTKVGRERDVKNDK